MQTLRFSPLSTASFREKRIARKPAAGAEPAERSTGARTAPHSYSLPGNYATLWAAAAGLSAAFQANPVLADTLSHPVVNTAQSFGSVGVVLVTASAAAYGGILILQQTLKSLQTQPSARSATQLSTDDHRRTGANSPSWALSTPTGPSSLASLSFQESPVKRASPSAPQRPPQQPQGPLSAPAQTSPTAEEPDKIRPLKPSAANVKPVDTAADIETPLPSRAIQNAIAEDSLFSPAKGKALQAVFRSSGHGCAGHARAAVDKVSDLLSQVAEPAPEPELVTAQPTLQAENLPAAQASEPMEQRQKAEDLAARFAETADSAGNLMEAGVRVALTAQEQQALYNQQLRKVQQDANRRAAEVARQQKQRERILQNMQPPNLEPERYPVPAAVQRSAASLAAPLAGIASFFASLVAWMQVMWQRLMQAIFSRNGSSPQSA